MPTTKNCCCYIAGEPVSEPRRIIDQNGPKRKQQLCEPVAVLCASSFGRHSASGFYLFSYFFLLLHSYTHRHTRSSKRTRNSHTCHYERRCACAHERALHWERVSQKWAIMTMLPLLLLLCLYIYTHAYTHVHLGVSKFA